MKLTGTVVQTDVLVNINVVKNVLVLDFVIIVIITLQLLRMECSLQVYSSCVHLIKWLSGILLIIIIPLSTPFSFTY